MGAPLPARLIISFLLAFVWIRIRRVGLSWAVALRACAAGVGVVVAGVIVIVGAGAVRRGTVIALDVCVLDAVPVGVFPVSGDVGVFGDGEGWKDENGDDYGRDHELLHGDSSIQGLRNVA
jgi:hypothetical protein